MVCVGLDTELAKIPEKFLKRREPLFLFNKAVIDATYDLVCAYKPNIAFYEAEGIEGLKQLKKTIEYINYMYSEIPVILDAKRADIGNTARMYAKAVFEYWDVDAVTVYPHLGLDSLKPFFSYKNRLVILLLKTSNPDSKLFQDVRVKSEPYYLKMAKIIRKWTFNNIGIFVGATYPEELRKVREIFPKNVFLSAGLGTQGGEVKKAVQAGIDRNGRSIMFNASRTIIYASKGKDFTKQARKEAIILRDTINQFRS